MLYYIRCEFDDVVVISNSNVDLDNIVLKRSTSMLVACVKVEIIILLHYIPVDLCYILEDVIS
jgi:hypothetical protein